MVEPSGYTSLGLIGYTDRGAYSGAANYVKNDLVHYGGSVWRVLIDDTTGITPTEGANYTIFISDPTTNISNRNLIDNAWFTVNQRGFVSGAPNGYCVDRWKTTSANMTVAVVNGGGITLTSATAQTEIVNQLESDLRDRLLGRTLTFSVMLSDGSILSDTFALPSSLPGSTTHYSDIDLDANFEARVAISAHGAKPLYVHIRTNANVSSSASITIKAVKLEIGTLSTLGEDTIPDYAFELAKCQTSTADSADTYSNMGDIVVSEQLDNEVTARSRLGAHNLLDVVLEELKSLNILGTWNDNTYTRDGVTFTVNEDMSVTVNSTSGTHTSNIPFVLKAYTTDGTNNGENPFIGKDIILNGCPSGGSNSTYFLDLSYIDGNQFVYDYGSGVEFNPKRNTNNYQRLSIVACANYTGANDIVFKPMIRLAEDASPEYGPYTKTNQELTDDVIAVEKTISDEITTRSLVGAHNLCGKPLKTAVYSGYGITISTNVDGVSTISGVASSNGGSTTMVSDFFTLKKGTYAIHHIASTTPAPNLAVRVRGGDVLASVSSSTPKAIFTLTADTECYIGIAVTNGVTYYCTLSPLITAEDDPSEEYTPFAMSNKQLTEIVDDTYSTIAENAYVGINGDGVKTIQTCINELAVAFLNMFSSLGDNEYALVKGLRIDGNDYMALNPTTAYSKGSSSVSLIGNRIVMDANNIKPVYVNVGTTLSNCHLYASNISSNGSVTITTGDNSASKSGTSNYRIYYRKVRKN